jgi:hypothetical protein
LEELILHAQTGYVVDSLLYIRREHFTVGREGVTRRGFIMRRLVLACALPAQGAVLLLEREEGTLETHAILLLLGVLLLQRGVLLRELAELRERRVEVLPLPLPLLRGEVLLYLAECPTKTTVFGPQGVHASVCALLLLLQREQPRFGLLKLGCIVAGAPA